MSARRRASTAQSEDLAVPGWARLEDDLPLGEVRDLLAGHPQQLAVDVVVVLAHDGSGAPDLAGRLGHAPGDAGVLHHAHLRVLILEEEAALVEVRVFGQLAVHERRESGDAGRLQPLRYLERVERRRPLADGGLEIVLVRLAAGEGAEPRVVYQFRTAHRPAERPPFVVGAAGDAHPAVFGETPARLGAGARGGPACGGGATEEAGRGHVGGAGAVARRPWAGSR